MHLVIGYLATHQVLTLIQRATLHAMTTAEINYTTPKSFKEKKIDLVPKGPTMSKEEAMQSWYVEFFYDAETQSMKHFRFSKNLNRKGQPSESFTKMQVAPSSRLRMSV